jgi:SAM-dependent methyltransferase
VKRSPNYERIADSYDQRFQDGDADGVATLIHSTFDRLEPRRLLEAACGTGHWLSMLRAPALVVGLDRSPAMLHQAIAKGPASELVQGDACALPLVAAWADAVLCVHALHHFDPPSAFLAEAARVLQPGGHLLIVGANPHSQATDWYVYRYFEGVRQRDLDRFPHSDEVAGFLLECGMTIEGRGIAERIRERRIGPDVFNDPFLDRHGSSQLALLSAEAFDMGMDRIRRAVQADRGQSFVVRMDLEYLLARRPLDR